MPQVFKVGSYWVYFWANENDPLEPVHVHVCQGAPNGNATKIWITRAGGCILCNNNSRIPDRVLQNTMSGVRSKKPVPPFQLMPQEQCCKPINCCFILCPQRGHFLLFFPIRMV